MNCKEHHIYYIILLALIIRLVFLLSVHLFPANIAFHANDSKGYIALAKELSSHGRFVNSLEGTLYGRPHTPEIVRTPGYPLFLIPGIWLGNLELVTIFLQIILCCLTVFYTYKLSLILFNNIFAALTSAALVAIDPMSIFFTIYILSETLFAFLIIVFVYYYVTYINSRELKYLIIASISLVISIFVRPIGYYLTFLLALGFIVFKICTRKFDLKVFVHTCIFLLIVIIPVSAWQVRNYVTAQYPGFSAISECSIYFHNAAAVLAKKMNTSYTDLQVKMGQWDVNDYFKVHPEQRSWTEAERFRYMKEQSLNIIKNNPLIYAKIHLMGMLRVLFDPGMVKYFKLFRYQDDQVQFIKYLVDNGIVATIKIICFKRPLMFIFYVISGALLFAIIVFACWSLISKNMHYTLPIILMLLIIMYIVFISGGPTDNPRYRLPIMPLISIFAGFGLSDWLQKRTGKQKNLSSQ
ncbi:MAG: glycosyltransferase family 39 protein [Syntrophales bacterium]|nr:glycosyltransferase family 39 protein [Syntrophales bacterium]